MSACCGLYGPSGHHGRDGQVSTASTKSTQSTGHVCAIARSWLGTPYHHRGRVKGAGVDCAMFPLEVYREAGLIPDLEIPYYPQDWMMHRSEEVYLDIVLQVAAEVSGDRLQGTENCPTTCSLSPVTCFPGDFVLYHFGRTWSHGAIVFEWPLIIHAVVHRGVILSDGENEGMLVGRKRRFFRIRAAS